MSPLKVIINVLVFVCLECLIHCSAQAVDHCAPNPCTNGGTCLERIDGFVCECMTNYTGIHCDIPDYCQSAPCLHGGKCTDTTTSFVCTCDGTGYAGPTCDLPVDDCTSNPCQNGGTCVDAFKSYTCTCIPGFAGELCEVEMSACVSDPCQNGGTCVDVHAGTNPGQISPGYSCQCVKGVAGDNCQVNYDDCWVKPCHTGRCVDGINSYTCDCTGSGYSGIHCEHKNTDQCLLSPCQNSATCIQDKDEYHCRCLPFQEGLITHGGKNCSVLLRGCENVHACQNGGVCVPFLVNEEKNVHSYTCSCAHGFRGKVCDSVTTMTVSTGSYIRKTYTKDFKLELRFRTSEEEGVLLYYRIGQSFVSVEIVNGSLYLVSGDATSIQTSQEVITSDLISDSHWHELVFDASDNVTLTLRDPLCNSTDDCTLHLPLSSFPPDVFKEIFLGHVTVSPWLRATLSKTDFDGCFQDVMSNNDVILPSNFGVAEFHKVKLSCPDCFARTCQGLGRCTPVNATDFTCVCAAGIQNGRCLDDNAVRCDFDHGMCKWTQGTGDAFDWTRQSGPTGSTETGPSADHTTGHGYYMYTEASNPRTTGQQAYLWSPYFDVLTPTCVSFWVNMYGQSMGSLYLYQRTTTHGQTRLWSKSGGSSAAWVEHKANLQIARHTRLEFVGSIGSSYYSDMAIDDINLEYNRC